MPRVTRSCQSLFLLSGSQDVGIQTANDFHQCTMPRTRRSSSSQEQPISDTEEAVSESFAESSDTALVHCPFKSFRMASMAGDT